MKTNRHELLYLVLNLIVLVFAGFIYLTFKDRYQVTDSKPVQTSYTKSSTSDTSDSDKEIKEFEKELKELEAQPSQDALTALQNKLDKSDAITDKDSYQERLDAVATELTQQEAAETSVVTAENYQSTEKLNAAQELVDTLTTKTVREELQARLDVITANIQSYLTSQVPVAPTNQGSYGQSEINNQGQ